MATTDGPEPTTPRSDRLLSALAPLRSRSLWSAITLMAIGAVASTAPSPLNAVGVALVVGLAYAQAHIFSREHITIARIQNWRPQT